jgi:hypothetical protein
METWAKTLRLIFILIFLVCNSLTAQQFIYQYTDPCTQELKFINADMSSPIVIAYYGQVKTFSYTELQDGTFDNWINSVYLKYQSTSPCQGVGVTTTTTTTTNTTLNIVSNVMNLGAISNVGSVNIDVGSSTSSGTNIGTTKTNNNNDNRTNSRNRTSSSSSRSGSSGSSSGEGGQSNGGGNSSETSGTSSGNSPDPNPGSSGEGNGGSSGSSSSSSSSGGNSSGSGSSGSSSGSSQGGGGSGGKTEEKTEVQTEKPSEQKVEETKTEQQKTQSSSTAKAANKAKAEVAKPAILVTGDLVGIQTKSDGAQDARGTASFTRVKGDGTSSLGFSADYMVNARIGNISCVRSWIGANKKGNKHISVISDGLSVMPKSMSNTLLFVRVNSVKNFTALYGAAGTYGKLFGEEMISTIAIGGFMYKGKLTKHIDATVIMAGIYSPYSKYYTESIFEAKPIVIPFFNFTYKMTKTFGLGITGGGTYVAGQDILNFQLLMGAKLLI